MSNATADQTSLPTHQNPKQKIKPTARVRKRLQDAPPVTLTVTNLAHDGRGVASYGDQPTITLINMAKSIRQLALSNGETVSVKITGSRKAWKKVTRWDVVANANHHTTFARIFGVCGGCSLQHWQTDGQIQFKQSVLAELLEPSPYPAWKLAPIGCWPFGLPHKARMGVRYVEKKAQHWSVFVSAPVIFGKFKWMPYFAWPACRFWNWELKALISSLDARDHIPQLELAMGETLDDVIDSKNQLPSLSVTWWI